jgi:DNA invertase Pin-like site-specific DNA recombinase
MIKDSATHKFDVVVVYKLSRFARSRYDSAMYKTKLRQNGVKVISASEPISDNPEGALVEGIFEALDEFYSKSLAQDVRRGMYENATKGLSVGGTLPLGYVVVDKQYRIDPLTAPIVQFVFESYADGMSCANIAAELNRRGYSNQKGKPFQKDSFKNMLRNPRYVGKYIYKGGEVVLENAIPALVSQELYNRVQRRFERNKKSPAASRGSVDYLLTTRLFCGACGRPIAGECGKSHTGAYHYYYACSGKKRGLGCKMPSLRKDDLEQIIIDHARRLLRPSTIRRVAKAAMEEYNRQMSDNSALESLENRLVEVNKGIDNLISMMEKGAGSPALIERLNALEEQKVNLSCEIAELKSAVPKLSELSIIRWLGTFAAQGDMTSVEYGRNIVDILVNSIHVYHEDGRFRIFIAYNLSGETEEIITNEDIASILDKEKAEPEGSTLSAMVHHDSPNTNLYIIRGILICQAA